MTVQSHHLRLVIAVDAAACALGGAALALDAGQIAPVLGVPVEALPPLGLFLIVYAAGLVWLASRPALPRAVVWTLVAVNLAWTAESVALPILGWAQPTGGGLALLLVQAAGALLVADLQFLALRKARRETMA